MERVIDVVDGVARIPIRRDGSAFTLVDAVHLDLVAPWSWYAHSCGKGKFYARSLKDPAGDRSLTYLHRLIAEHALPLPSRSGLVVDHINGNGLDNREANLRWRCPVVNRWHGARHGRNMTLATYVDEIAKTFDPGGVLDIPF